MKHKFEDNQYVKITATDKQLKEAGIDSEFIIHNLKRERERVTIVPFTDEEHIEPVYLIRGEEFPESFLEPIL